MHYFKNPEIKSITFKFIILGIIFMSLCVVTIQKEISSLNKNYIIQNTIIAGNILSDHPEMEKEIVSALTLKNMDNFKLGEKILDKYSYEKDLDIYKNPVMYDFLYKVLCKFILEISIFLIIVYLTVFGGFKGFYKKAEKFSKASEDIIEGKFQNFKNVNKEGDLAILTYHFNLMANSQRDVLLRLKKEKIFLKNIISDISHQLKTPLSSLIMFNEIMKNQNIPKEDRDNFLKLSDEQLRRMEWLIVNLLKVGRLEAGVVQFRIINNPLYITINKSLIGLIEKSKEKQQKIIIKGNKDIYFKHDAEWTAEALSNIIKNCIEHTDVNGQILISYEETPISTSIKIKDNGEGIPKERIGRIFQRFYKGENSTNPCSIGIGLALSKTIIESQNGSISVKSEEGKGTEFSIIFLKTII